MSSLPLEPAKSLPAQNLRGTVRVPGDKSISHRSLMFGTLAVGETRVSGLLTGEDVMATGEAMRRLGAQIERDGDDYVVNGVGVGGLREPSLPLDMGNSGTSTRLILGMLATHDLTAVVFGDASLNKRPMARVTVPLASLVPASWRAQVIDCRWRSRERPMPCRSRMSRRLPQPRSNLRCCWRV